MEIINISADGADPEDWAALRGVLEEQPHEVPQLAAFKGDLAFKGDPARARRGELKATWLCLSRQWVVSLDEDTESFERERKAFGR